MTLIIPNLLKAGDQVAVVAPARVVNEKAVKKGIKILSDWGLRVWEGKSLYKSHHYLQEQTIKDYRPSIGAGRP